MGTIELNNKVKELREMEKFIEEAQAELESMKDEIKAEMTRRGVDEIETDLFTVRWREVTSKKFNSKMFREQHEDLYEAFRTPQTSKRFTIS